MPAQELTESLTETGGAFVVLGVAQLITHRLGATPIVFRPRALGSDSSPRPHVTHQGHRAFALCGVFG